MSFALQGARVLGFGPLDDAGSHALSSLNEVHVGGAFALVGLQSERLADCLEDIFAAKLTSVGVVVDGDRGIQEDSQSLFLLTVGLEENVVRSCVSLLLKAVLYAVGYLCHGREILHVVVHFVSTCRQVLHSFFAPFEEIG